MNEEEFDVTESGVISAVSAAAAGPVAARAAATDREGAFPRESCEALAAAGGLGLMVPVEAGGAGAGLVDLAGACEAVAAACASTAMIFLMHQVAVATVASGGGARAPELLSRLGAGSLGALAFSERGTGAHFYSPELRAVARDGGLAISGRKSFVTGGGEADLYLVLVQTPTGEGADCYAVESTRPGISFEGRWEGLGLAGNSSIAMVLDDLEVGEADRIGPPSGGADLVFGVVAPAFLVGLAAVNVGIAAAAMASAIEHVKDRSYPDGSTLAEIQVVQHAIADMDMVVRRARLLVAEAAHLGDAGDEGALVPIMEGKVAAAEAAVEVTQKALEVCGGQAYTPGLPIERHLRDARAGAVMAPTNAVLRNWIGRALTGLPVP